jgi:hypothetical protein
MFGMIAVGSFDRDKVSVRIRSESRDFGFSTLWSTTISVDRTTGLVTRLSAVMIGLALAVALAACGSSGHASETTASPSAPHRTHVHRRKPVARTLVYRALYSLPAALRDPAFAPLAGGRFVLIGGLDSADVSSAGILVADRTRVIRSATLPLAQHDAQAAALDGRVYVFGGGSISELDHIISFDPAGGTVAQVGVLPHTQSDVAVAATASTAYVIGGYDGVDWLNSILAWRPGRSPVVVGHLPVGLRYAAATVVDGQVIVIGGSTRTGASAAILRFDPATGTVTQIGRLPHPITHASAAALDGFAYLIGGRGDDLYSQVAGVLAINPRDGAVTRAGTLPGPLSDTAAVASSTGIVVIGGESRTGTIARVGQLLPRQ